MWPVVVEFVSKASIVVLTTQSEGTLLASKVGTLSASGLVAYELGTQTASHKSKLSPEFSVTASTTTGLLSVSPYGSDNPSTYAIVTNTTTYGSTADLSGTTTSNTLAMVLSPLVVVLTFNAFLAVNGVITDYTTTNVSVTGLSSASTQRLLTSSPGTLMDTFVALIYDISLPAFVQRTCGSLFSPMTVLGRTNSATTTATTPSPSTTYS